MKKIILASISLLIISAFAGCSLKKEQTGEAKADPTATTTTVETVEEVTPPTPTTTEEAKEEKTAAKTEVKVEAKAEVKADAKVVTEKPVVKTFNLTAKKFDFSPSTITVKQGDTVRITVTSANETHGFVIPDFGVNKVINPGAPVTVEFVANKKGTFTFRCSVFCGEGHGKMTGTLVVE